MEKLLKAATYNKATEKTRREEAQERLRRAASLSAEEVSGALGASDAGMDTDGVERARARYGANVVGGRKKASLPRRLLGAFVDPFTVVLVVIAVVSVLTDVVFAAAGEKDPVTAIIIAVMVVVSGALRFVQETRSDNAAAKLSALICTTADVQRADGRRELPLGEIVVGDTVFLSAGDMIPADVRITRAKDLFISQSALTGESEPVEKTAAANAFAPTAANPCLAFMGSTVIGGSAAAVVVAVGAETMLGAAAGKLAAKAPKTAFEKGVGGVSRTLIAFMLVMAPLVLVVNGLTKNDWAEAALFAVSVAVGLTPEMLPMIVTTCLAKGALSLSKRKVIVKKLNSIQDLGAVDVLCTDKTGTLTQDRVALEYHLDVRGVSDDRVLRHAFLNSYFQTGLKNLTDVAVIERMEALAATDPQARGIAARYRKVDEVPFDFHRRRMSVVVADASGKTQMITKGAIEEMLAVCAFVEDGGAVTALTEEMKEVVLRHAARLNDAGMRVLGVAQKTDPSPVGAFSVRDEADMVLIGYLAFLDPPKDTTADALRRLAARGVRVKVLTGDNEKVTACICRKVGLPVSRVLLGAEIAAMTDAELRKACEEVTVFAKLSPTDKERVVTALRLNGHCVAYMGDGVNDAAAMKASDVGISVDTAVDIAKEAADVVLLEKDLTVLADGIEEGRRTYANTIKYIKLTASSNFGNMFSVLAASVFLPFLPMAALQLILLNMIYDLSCTAIPWDNVDEAMLRRPCVWNAGAIGRFMLFFGPISSLFDVATYLILYFVVCPSVCGGPYASLTDAAQAQFVAVFRAGWFVESMWSQTLAIHLIRSPRIAFFGSRASASLLAFGGLAVAAATVLPFTPLGEPLGLHALPAVYFALLAAVLAGYALAVAPVKRLYVRKCGSLL